MYKNKGLRINASNLCSEVLLPSDEKWSAVCDLASMNILHFDEWKDTDAIETLTFFLDAVMTEFIEKLECLRESDDPADNQAFLFMERAHTFAVAHRALGIGALGWHSYLQSKMLPFDSAEAYRLNKIIFNTIQDKAYEASRSLAKEYGEPDVLKGYGRRNTTLCAVAPTTPSAFILGQVSQSIEPIWSNCYVKDIDKMKVTVKNPVLESMLAAKGKNDKATWDSIRDHDGSVQHLEFLSAEEREVFKTFAEIDQNAIIEQAADRQAYIDQGQSLNLMINPNLPIKEINNFYIRAWKLGIKTLYYQHSINAAQELSRKKICLNCQS